MNILITGAAGYLGSQLTQYLLFQGHHVTAFDNMTYGCESLLFAAHQPQLSIIKGDVRNTEQIMPILSNTDCMIYLAGIVGEPACETNQLVARQINYDAARSILEQAGKAGIEKIIFISTCSNYGVSEPNALADETSKLNPLSEYAKAKVDIENYLLDALVDRCTVLRLGTLCGLSARMRFDLLVNEIARSSALDQEILIYSPEAWRPYLAIEDAARQISRVACNEWHYKESPVFNVVGENLRKSDLVDIVLTHNPGASIRYRDTSPDLRDYRVCGKKFEQQFSTTCSTSIESSLLSISEAVAGGYFPDPTSPRHSAIPPAPLT